MNENPLVSILITHKWDRGLSLLINSIKRQTYKDLEIIIQIDRGENNANVLRNRGEVGCSGDFLFFCDDDVRLHRDCLQSMVKVLIENPDVSFVYCNYDKQGVIHGIEYAKPWNLEELKKRNYISTMSLVRRKDFIRAGSFDENLKRYQDWDLWLRMGECGYEGYYINETLFTAYFTESRTSFQGPYDRKVFTDVIRDKHKIKYKALSIIIPFYNQVKLTEQCIHSIVQNTGGDYEIILIDDGSEERFDYDCWSSFAKVISNRKREHHSECCNIGVEASVGEYIILLNNDTIVSRKWNNKLINTFQQIKDVSCLGPLTSYAASPQQLEQLYPHRHNIQPSEVNVIQKDVEKYIPAEYFKSKITGFCFLTSRELWKTIGSFSDEIPAGGNEADWILRAYKLGLHPYIDTSVYVHHYGNQSYQHENKKELWNIGREKLIERYGMDDINWLENLMYIKLLKEKRLGGT